MVTCGTYKNSYVVSKSSSPETVHDDEVDSSYETFSAEAVMFNEATDDGKGEVLRQMVNTLRRKHQPKDMFSTPSVYGSTVHRNMSSSSSIALSSVHDSLRVPESRNGNSKSEETPESEAPIDDFQKKMEARRMNLLNPKGASKRSAPIVSSNAELSGIKASRLK